MKRYWDRNKVYGWNEAFMYVHGRPTENTMIKFGDELEELYVGHIEKMFPAQLLGLKKVKYKEGHEERFTEDGKKIRWAGGIPLYYLESAAVKYYHCSEDDINELMKTNQIDEYINTRSDDFTMHSYSIRLIPPNFVTLCKENSLSEGLKTIDLNILPKGDGDDFDKIWARTWRRLTHQKIMTYTLYFEYYSDFDIDTDRVNILKYMIYSLNNVKVVRCGTISDDGGNNRAGYRTDIMIVQTSDEGCMEVIEKLYIDETIKGRWYKKGDEDLIKSDSPIIDLHNNITYKSLNSKFN